MVNPIQSTVGNTAIFYGTKADTEKSSTPKTDVTQSSATINAKGNNATLQTGVTTSSAMVNAIGDIAISEVQTTKTSDSGKTTPDSNAGKALLALALKENVATQTFAVKNMVNPEGVIAAYKK